MEGWRLAATASGWTRWSSNSGAVRARAEVPFTVPDTAVDASLPAQATVSKRSDIAPAQQRQLAAGVATVLPDGGSPTTVVVPKIATTTVTRGDNLWRLSRLTYGAGTRYAVIYRANRKPIRNPDFILARSLSFQRSDAGKWSYVE